MKSMKGVFVLGLLFFCFLFFVPNIYSQGQQESQKGIVAREKLLNLTDAQKTQLQNLRKKWQEERKELREKMRVKRNELRDMMKDPKADRGKTENLRDEIFEIRLSFMKNSYLHRKEVRNVFTPEQLEKLTKIRSNIPLKMMFRGHRMAGHPGMYGKFRRQGTHFWRGRNLRRPLFMHKWRWQ